MTQEQHDQIQYWLVEKLKSLNYPRIYQNTEYRVTLEGRVLTGEVDVLAQSPHGKWHFYEIKSCKKKIEYAREQYARFKEAHPYAQIRGVFLSPNYASFL